MRFLSEDQTQDQQKRGAEDETDERAQRGTDQGHMQGRNDMAEAVEDAFRYGKIILATTTYNAEIFPFMREFIHHLTERNFANHKIGLIENGSWAPMAAKVIKGMFEKSKNITWLDTTVTVRSALKSENIAQIDAMAQEMMK